MKLPVRNAKTNILYLKIGDLEIKKEYELHLLVDFVNGLSASESSRKANDLIVKKALFCSHIAISKVYNFRKALYQKMKILKVNGIINFSDYCMLKGISLDRLESIRYKNEKSFYLRNYLQDVLDIKGEIKIIRDKK